MSRGCEPLEACCPAESFDALGNTLGQSLANQSVGSSFASVEGDPLGDFTYYLMSWVMPSDGRAGLGGVDVTALNIPTIDEVVRLYCEKTGRDGIPNLEWYFAYNAFRLACILQGIIGRIRDGTAASAHATQMADRIRPLAATAYMFGQRAGLK